MARTVDIRAHREKRDAILDVLERLIVGKGYDQLTIADIMGRASISKGAFYHYFRSKSDVLSALLDRRIEAWRELLTPIVEADRPALARLNELLGAIAAQKTADRAFLLEVAVPVYADENARVYLLARTTAAGLFAPLVRDLLEDARREQTVRIDDAEETAEVVVCLIQDLADRTGRALLAVTQGTGEPERLPRVAAAHLDALERVLGAEPGVLDFLGPADLQAWAAAADQRRTEQHQASGDSHTTGEVR